MKWVHWVILTASLMLMGFSAQADPEFIPGEYVVQLKDGSKVQSFGYDVKAKHNKIIVVRPLMIMSQSFVIDDLRNNPNVKYVEPNYIYKISRLPDDPQLENLWGLVNLGQDSPIGQSGVNGVDIGAEKAWDIQTGNPELIVAVIDTGVDPLIEDLKDNMWINEGEIPGNGIDDDENGYIDDVHGYNFADDNGDPTDKNGHGSHSAGVIGAKGDNGIGITGVAWDVKIMALKFLSSRGGTLEGAVKAIDYAREMGAHIMSNSWGGGPASDILREAIERADEAGILFVAASGNDGKNNDDRPTYPASYEIPNILSVAAIDNRGTLASFSNFGAETVHIAAPGVDILSSTPHGYTSMSGTSMAAPHVSGVAALLLSEEPYLTPEELIERLMRTSRPLASLRGRVMSGGVVNAYYSLMDELAPQDENDPFHWSHLRMSQGTAHPYESNDSLEFEVYVPGAEAIALYFTKFETERGFDKLIIFNEEGEEVVVMSGNLGETYSPVIEGERITVKFVSDRSNEDHGFEMFGVAYR